MSTNPATSLYGSRKPIIVKKFYKDNDKFIDPTNKLKRELSDEMKEICKAVGEMAVDRQTPENFITFYNNDKDEFLGAWFQYITDGVTQNVSGNDKSENVGFLFSIFYRRIHITDCETKVSYIGKAFPALRVEERLKRIREARLKIPPKDFDRSELFESFLPFYQTQILEILKVENPDIQEIDLDSLHNNEEDIKWIINYLLNKIPNFPRQIPDMTIEIYVENPVTYKDLCQYGFKYNINENEKLSNELFENFKRESKNWDTGELLRQSYIKSLGPGPEYLKHEIAYSVNITPMEWRYYFTIPNDYIRYYVWQNFNFPNSAFKVIIPVNAHNVGMVIKNNKNISSTQRRMIDELLNDNVTPSPPSATP